jgi:hypothetical protein
MKHLKELKTNNMDKHPKNKALERAKQPRKDSGHYVSPQGVRYLSKKESAEKTKNWPKAVKGGSVAWPETDEQKREHQRRFKRAWND